METLSKFFRTFNSKDNSQIQNLAPDRTVIENNDNIYVDGTIMLFPTNLAGSEWYLGQANPNTVPTFCTDSQNNKIFKKKEANITYWNTKSGVIRYRSSNQKGRSCRLNIFPSTTKQVNDWHAAIKQGFIGSSKDLRNQEITFVGRLHTIVHSQLYTTIKIRGGGHHNHAPDQAACIGMSVSHMSRGNAARRSKELIHPVYEYEELSPKFEFYTEDNVWFAMKLVSWNNNQDDYGTVTNRCYIDSNPFLRDGSLRNDYRLYSEWIDYGNGQKYKEIVNWAGGVPITVRIDGWDSVDFYALNAREITAPL
jgi:hypothetical protein